MRYSPHELLETINMVQVDKLDIRTVTLGINLLRAVSSDRKKFLANIEKLIWDKAKDLVEKTENIEKRYGIPVINKRITITPFSLCLNAGLSGNKIKDLEFTELAGRVLDKVAKKVKVDFLGGFGCLVEKGMGYSDQILLESLPNVLTTTERVCAFVNVGSSKAGINMKVIARLGNIIHNISQKKKGCLGCAKLVVFCNAVSDNPFMAGGFHGLGQGDEVINIGISGPGVVRRALENIPQDLTLDQVSEAIKKATFKITRAGELIGKEVAKSIGVKFGSIDLSLAPTTAKGDSIGEILELLGLETVGTHGTTAALALLTDAVKKGGLMASSSIGGLSGAFIPVAEDTVLSTSVGKKCLTLDKLEAMTSICSVGLDMVPVPGDTRSTTISAIIADEAAIGMMNHKTTATRIIPVQGKKAGEYVKFGGLLGESYIMPVHQERSDRFIWRKGQIPPSVTSFRN